MRKATVASTQIKISTWREHRWLIDVQTPEPTFVEEGKRHRNSYENVTFQVDRVKLGNDMVAFGLLTRGSNMLTRRRTWSPESTGPQLTTLN
ncbi:hypothetical protein [Streptomyces sp. NPDC012508]|uniref:hypothetical protein n=1 Tax=Streptomyces sp. NPDC012508 TaxID=3364837 RepID=UPI003685DBCC